MYYTISEVADMFHLSISTLRYYDKEGLFPKLERQSGIRKFTDREIEALRVIECLKKSGLEIKEIRQFIDWCMIGPSTYQDRYDLICQQKEKVEEKIEKLNQALAMLQYKTWYYEKALETGSEDAAKSLTPDHLPKEIKEAYEKSHQ